MLYPLQSASSLVRTIISYTQVTLSNIDAVLIDLKVAQNEISSLPPALGGLLLTLRKAGMTVSPKLYYILTLFRLE